MATYYHLRINLLSGMSGTMLEGYTCKGLTRAVAKLDELTGRAWPYQVLHRTLKAAGVWSEAYTEPATGNPEKGTYHGPRAVVASLECAGAQPDLWLRLPDELPLHCWQCYEPLLRASNGWHSCMKHGAPHNLEKPEQLRERAQRQMKYGKRPPLTNKALQFLQLMVKNGEASTTETGNTGVEFFALVSLGLAENIHGPGFAKLKATATGAAYVASLERWQASAGCADEDEGPAPYQLEFAAKEAAAEPVPAAAAAAAAEPAADITDDWEACRELYQEMQRKYLIAMDKKWPGCNRKSHPHLFEPGPAPDITDEWEVANAIFTDAIMQWNIAFRKKYPRH
jgi:hypothetical protein